MKTSNLRDRGAAPWSTPASLETGGSLPAGLPADSYFVMQWYLSDTYGIRAAPVWNDYTGDGVLVAVFDQGIDKTHAELDGSFQQARSTDAATLSGTGLPRTSGDNHGTAVAGVIAAERNGAGIVGAAYGAELVSIYTSFSTSQLANAFEYARQFDVLNN